MSLQAAWLHFCCLVAKLSRGRSIQPHIEGLKREFYRALHKPEKITKDVK